MDFSNFDKIFSLTDESKKYNILKSVVYIKVKEQPDLDKFLSLLCGQLSDLITLPAEKAQDDIFLLLILLISQTLKEKPSLLGLISNENANKLLKACNYFLFSFSMSLDHSFFVRKTLVKILAYLPDVSNLFLKEHYDVDNLLKWALEEKNNNTEEYTLEHRLRLFQSLLNFVRDFLFFMEKKEIVQNYDTILRAVFHNLTMILLWNEETQQHYLLTSTKEFKIDFLTELCEGIRKEILKFFLEVLNSSKTMVAVAKKEMKTSYFLCKKYCSGAMSSQMTPKAHDFLRVVCCIWSKTEFDLSEEIFQTKWLWDDIMEGLSSNDSRFNKFSINLFVKIANQINEVKTENKDKSLNFMSFYNVLKIFVDLYLTLDSYASHLIKAIYNNFTTILKYKQEDYQNIAEEMPIIKYFDSSTFAVILLKKAIVHDNLAVRKYSVKTFLKFNIHLKNFEHFIFSSLFEILNTSVFYKDVSYEEDSKFYPILTNYFLSIFTELPPNELRQNLRIFLSSIEKYTTYCHPLIPLFNVFEKLALEGKTIDFFGAAELTTLEKIIRKNYEPLQNRKRVQFFNGIMHLLFNFVDFQQVDFAFFKALLEMIPWEIFQLKSYLHTFSKVALFEMVSQQKPLNELINNTFLNREKLFLWLVLAPKNVNLLENVYKLANECYKNLEDFDFIVRFLSVFVISKDYFPEKAHRDHILKLSNGMILNLEYEKVLGPFFSQLSLYQDCYKPTKTSILLLKKLNDLLGFPFQEGSQEFQAYICFQLTNYAGEIFPYLNLKLSEDSEDLAEFYENREAIASLIENTFRIAIASKGTYSSTSKLVQNLAKFESFLLEKIELFPKAKKEIYPVFLLKILNSILTVFSDSNEKYFQEDFHELFHKGFDLVSLVLSQDTLNSERYFNNIKNISVYNYLCLLESSDPNFKAILDRIFSDIFDLCDQCNIDSYAVFFRFLGKLYIPHMLRKIDVGEESVETLAKFMKMCRNNLVENCKWTFRYPEVHTLMEFMLNEQLFFSEKVLASKLLSKIITETWELGAKHWLIQRAVVDQLFRVFYQHPEKMSAFNDVIIFLLKSKENRGYDANLLFYLDENYLPKINEIKRKLPYNADFFGSYPRYLILSLLDEKLKSLISFIDSENQPVLSEKTKELAEFFFNLVLKLLDINFLARMKVNCLPYTKEHREKLYIWQALCTLQKLISSKICNKLEKKGFECQVFLKKIQESTWKNLEMNNLPTIRQYIEIFSLNYLYNFTNENIALIVQHLKDANLKSQFSISIIFMVGYFLCKAPFQTEFKLIFLKYFPYTMSNLAYLRAIAQYFSFIFMTKYLLSNEDAIYGEFLDYIVTHKDSIFLKDKFDLMLVNYEKILNDFDLDFLFQTKFDDFGELINASAVEGLKKILIDYIQDLKTEEKVPPKVNELWRIEADRLVEEHKTNPKNDHKQNFQRKIENIMDETLDLFEKSREFKQPHHGDLIVVATLIDKVPNLANLTRTCEIFGVSQLIIPNKDILNDEGFKSIAVTAEKWIQMLEIKQFELLSFLLLKKNLGYTLIGLEQTSESVGIEGFAFPDKCLLLLGRERTGIPIEFIDILDFCVEIPQFGTIRSLNVHISAVICIWEYVKQKLVAGSKK